MEKAVIMLLSLSILLIGQYLTLQSAAEPAVPAIFVFGDSSVDVGTNNYLPSCGATTNFIFYGIDYPHYESTGRFSNGYNIIDTVGMSLLIERELGTNVFLLILMGYEKSPQPFLFYINEDYENFKKSILNGVNFASGGAGILETIGRRFTKVITMNEQIQQFETVRGNISEVMGEKGAASLVSRSLFLFSIGSNEILESFSVNDSSFPVYMTTVMNKFEHQLKDLYQLGARKFALMCVPPLGCCPVKRFFSWSGGCNKGTNASAKMINREIEALLKRLESELKNMRYALGNSYAMFKEMMKNPDKYGFKEIKLACCGGGYFNGFFPCSPLAKLCQHRDEYLFWDKAHPSEAANKLAAEVSTRHSSNLNRKLEMHSFNPLDGSLKQTSLRALMAKVLNHFFLFFISIIVLSLYQVKATVPAVYIFGDSTADVGTNDFLNDSTAKANFLYNGIDYPYSIPTGRFSNGYNSADLIARLWGFGKSPDSFFCLLNNTSSFKRNILRGANFASGGSGIINTTGLQFFLTAENLFDQPKKVRVVSLGEQIQQFATLKSNLSTVLPPEKVDDYLSKSLFLVSVGSNDFFEYANGSTVPKEVFMATLLSEYQNHLQNLYALGARRFGIVSVPPIGCCPYIRYFNKTGGCADDLNNLAQVFYTAVQGLLQNMSSQLTGMKYSLGNAYEMTMNIIQNPLASGEHFHMLFALFPRCVKTSPMSMTYDKCFSNALATGFNVVDAACCGNGTLNAEQPCTVYANLCPNRNKYLFWDRYHPTQVASRLAALTLYGGGRKFVTPMNFSQLALVDL
ncbi:GDSL lipase/esterase [Dillenia turbinata]|uniref:GDSL lipase/esterase n=1 Tax=Dillenia turbinata TaxID=194707 RepID=A0AAN8Z6P0_9MAGN